MQHATFENLIANRRARNVLASYKKITGDSSARGRSSLYCS